MAVRQYKNKRERRRAKIRAQIRGTNQRPRLSVFRSNQHIYVQLIDDQARHTLTAASDLDGELKELAVRSAKEQAYEVGKLVGERAKEQGIKKAVFDRGGYAYHGKVEAVAEGFRSAGVKM